MDLNAVPLNNGPIKIRLNFGFLLAIFGWLMLEISVQGEPSLFCDDKFKRQSLLYQTRQDSIEPAACFENGPWNDEKRHSTSDGVSQSHFFFFPLRKKKTHEPQLVASFVCSRQNIYSNTYLLVELFFPTTTATILRLLFGVITVIRRQRPAGSSLRLT